MNVAKTSPGGIACSSREAGQASVLLILILAVFLVGSLAFAVDLGGMWFHRQSAQAAADAACLAGAADLITVAGGVTPPSAGFTAGTAGDCAATPGASMCKYANFNGYNGAGLSATAASNSVSWTFPSSVTGVTAPPVALTTHPFLKVLVTENVKTLFMGLFGTNYQQVGAACTCGVVSVKSVPPLLVLNPTGPGTFTTGGSAGAEFDIFGGPTRSVQVNSTDAGAVSQNGGNSFIDTSAAGPLGTGADVGVVGGPATPPATGDNLGTGSWVSPTLPIPDPYLAVPAPTKPADAPAPTNIAQGVDGCPDPSGCKEYSPGYYNSKITVNGSKSAVFQPGIYYMDGNLDLTGGVVRVAHSGAPPMLTGVMFYFNTGSIKSTGTSGATAGIDPISSDWLKCNPSESTPASVPASLNGNVLWSQCAAGGTYVGPGSSDTLSGTGTRGLLMFNAHTNTGASPSLAGGGSLLFSGVFYFSSSDHSATFTVSGNGGSNTSLVGEIVADNLAIKGGGAVKMTLNPAPTTNVLKVAMLQ
jgi:hypothetical protein